MGLLYNRVWEVSASDGTETKIWGRTANDPYGIDIAGTVEKTSDGTPNELELKIFGLAPKSREFLSRKGLTITVSAGYEGDLSGVIFRGTMEIPRNYRDGSDRVTEIKAKDGAFLFRNIRAKKAYKKKTDVEKIINDLLTSLSDSPVSAASFGVVAGFRIGTRKLTAVSGKKTKKSKVILGSALEELKGIARSYGLKLLINDQTVHLVSLTDPLNTETILLTPESGLLEVPEPLDDGNGYRFKSLLRHELNPGVQITAQSAQIDRALFNIDYCKFDFDSRGQNWYTEIEARTA